LRAASCGRPKRWAYRLPCRFVAVATAAEIVDVLVGVIPVVGLPSVVAAAPKLAMALGYDIETALEYQSGP
jgi:hypothetical protein